MKRKLPHKPISQVTPARREAFAILLEVEKGAVHADDLLLKPRISVLPSQDRNLCTTLVLGTLRWQIQLDSSIRAYLAKPNARLDPAIRIALRLGAFQLQHLDRIPAHAAIDESVSLAKAAGHKFASGMVNAVLRRLADKPRPENPGAVELAEAAAHPQWLVQRWLENYGPATAQAICHNGQQQPEISIRVTDAKVEQELTEQGIELAPGAILTAARRVFSGDITATQAFQTGQIRIQEEGSQLIAELAGHGSHILDACAAPGGKTLILAERNPQAHITACEISPSRLESLRQRAAGSRYAALIQCLQADATQLPEAPTYDLVLADVPCSGTGTLGRNPEIRHRLRPEDLSRHHQRQVAILTSALKVCSQRPDARVIYSTCSLEPEENQQVVAEVLSESPNWRQSSVAGPLSELRDEGILGPGADALTAQIAPDGSLTILPGSLGSEVQTDGFFIAILERQI